MQITARISKLGLKEHKATSGGSMDSILILAPYAKPYRYLSHVPLTSTIYQFKL